MVKAKMILDQEEVIFDDLVIEEGLVLVDFYADWCGPCKMMAPLLKDVAQNYDKVKMAAVDIELYESLALNFNISSMPTIIIFKDGKEIKRFIGFTPKSKIEYVLNENL